MPSKSKKNSSAKHSSNASCGCHHAKKSGTSPLRALSLPKKTSRTLREVHASRTYSPEHVAFVSDRLPLSATSLNKIAVDKFIHGTRSPVPAPLVIPKQVVHVRDSATMGRIKNPRGQYIDFGGRAHLKHISAGTMKPI